ncbi:MAG TPA: hypothetical protein VNT99_20815 [Methylomirabilota bacterium]|nr:hypothetical protein [Methylomirabilota bacterium]
MSNHARSAKPEAAKSAPASDESPEVEAGELLRQLLASPSSAKSTDAGQIITGHLQGIDDEGRILFAPEHGDGRAVPVAIGVCVSDGVLIPAARKHQRALVVRTTDSPVRLILIGLVRERVTTTAKEAAPGQLEVTMDGETLRLTAEHEIELKCGNASLVLRRSGRVILKGTHVVTSSSGPVKVKGATIALN